MNSYDVDLRVRYRNVYASSEDVAASNIRAEVADTLGPNAEVEPDEVLQTPADVLNRAASEVYQLRLRYEATADSAFDAGGVAAAEEIESVLRGMADAEERPGPQPAAVTIPGDPFAEAHDRAQR